MDRPRRIVFFALSFAFFFLATDLLALPQSSRKTRGKSEKQEGVTEDLSEDEAYVRQTLGEYLNATKIKWLDDGRLEIHFDFERMNPDHGRVFTPPAQTKIRARFRWSVPGEAYEIYSVSGSRSTYYDGGLRISGRGLALLNCWWIDDVEAEMIYGQFTSFSPNQTAALVFYGEKGEALGSNYGTECRVYRKGRPTKKRAGTPQSLTIFRSTRIGLVVRDGKFEARRGRRTQNSLPYSKKTCGAGKVGFLWAGNAAGMIVGLTITGRVDYEKTAKVLRKERKGSKRRK